MKTICFVRHATAEDRKKGVSDISRTLVNEGVKEAKNAAKRIKDRVFVNSRSVIFISSPANRALETAHIFARKLNYPESKILHKDAVYNDSSSKSFFTIIKEIDEVHDAAVLFGHNPSLSELTSSLIKGFKFDIPKSGIVILVFSQNSWKAIKKQTGILTYFEYPDEKSKKQTNFKRH
ncbi:MAG: hypothetical protein EHM85_06450 [Desulfobacteraceae bacterium]|nr:MAG: hypothetical protein EHM85_06450 [Desulfobacteraceae bacterium]